MTRADLERLDALLENGIVPADLAGHIRSLLTEVRKLVGMLQKVTGSCEWCNFCGSSGAHKKDCELARVLEGWK